MIARPRSHPQKPELRSSGGPDLLSEMLKAVRLTGSVFLNARFSAPFGTVDPQSFSERTPMAHLRHISVLHLIVSGSCNFETAGKQRRVSAGELLFLPFPDAYKFWNGESPKMVVAGDVVRPGPIEGMWTINHGGGGEETRIVCGYLESSELLFAPMFRTLPPVVVERTAEDNVGAHIASTVGEIVRLVDAATPGTQAVLSRLMELLFIEILRRHVASLPPETKGWFAALNDPIVGRTLQLLHSDPTRQWSIDEVAEAVGSSRTVVRDRFKSLIGLPPIEYVTGWRMRLAAERLRVGHESLASIAAAVGYASEAAFIRAFKRVTGETPGSRRRPEGPVVRGAAKSGATRLLERETVSALAARIAGTVHHPGDAAYEDACRLWNAMIERHPAIVVRPKENSDVAEVIAFARANDLPLSVRGGGHNVAGEALCERGVTIDMSRRRKVVVDAAACVVRVEPGATLKDLDAATRPYGLVVPSGVVSTTGIAGITLGGGFGWTSRKFGFTADNLLSAEVITADGEMCRASAHDNPDLFWALRGGGGNFGVITSFEFQAHRHGPRALCGMVVHPFAWAPDVMRLYRDVTTNAPDELTCLLVLRKAPPAPFLPRAIHGQRVAMIVAHWTGDPADGEEAMKPLKAFGPPIADTIEPKDFIAFQGLLDGGQPFGRRYYWKSDEASEVSDGLMTTLAECAAVIASPHSAIVVMQMGGAPTRVPPEATAVGIRGAHYGIVIQGAWEDAADDGQHIGWARDSFDALKPFSSGSAYVNYLTAEEGEARVRGAYGATVYDRLRRIKTIYDPENLFRGNLNIPPL
jgi:FAD/FMN-containing dehydrogenase/AraC-like DNA-binding protein